MSYVEELAESEEQRAKGKGQVTEDPMLYVNGSLLIALCFMKEEVYDKV